MARWRPPWRALLFGGCLAWIGCDAPLGRPGETDPARCEHLVAPLRQLVEDHRACAVADDCVTIWASCLMIYEPPDHCSSAYYVNRSLTREALVALTEPLVECLEANGIARFSPTNRCGFHGCAMAAPAPACCSGRCRHWAERC